MRSRINFIESVTVCRLPSCRSAASGSRLMRRSLNQLPLVGFSGLLGGRRYYAPVSLLANK